jgi:hypothetical protein
MKPRAFGDCTSLSSICIPSSVQIISIQCCSGCANLSTVTFEPGSKLSRLKDEAFRGCSSLSSICLPSSVQSIDGDCFDECPNLATITFEPRSQLSSIEHSE